MITFKHWGPKLASSRYRAIIPSRELASLGIGEGFDWLVIGKHGWDWEQETRGFKRVCFDICDDHFNDGYGHHYRYAARMADRLTCNSLEMARIIKAETGRDAVVIPDPYEQPEKPPHISGHLLWFGHRSNLEDVLPWAARLPNLQIVSNAPGVTQWSPEIMDRAFDSSGMVILPTGKSMAKSGNRAIESIRRGLFVVAGYLPSYADLGIYVGNIMDGIDWALTHEKQALERIKASQEYVREEYAPGKVAKAWLTVLEST